MHNSENVISFSSTISGLVALFKSLSFNDDLKSVNLLNQAVSKLPPNLKEAWSMQTVTRQWHRPTLVDFNEWVKEKAEVHERLKTTISKVKSEEPVKQKVGTKVFASNATVSDKTKKKPKFTPCSVCKGQHVLWNCAVFKEKNATQGAKHVAEQKLCFVCLQSNHSFRNCSKARKCPKPDCESTHNCSYMELRKFFLLRILKVPRRQVTQTLNLYRLTLPSAIFIARSQLKASCQLHHSPSLRMRRLLMP